MIKIARWIQTNMHFEREMRREENEANDVLCVLLGSEFHRRAEGDI